ncbi:MAG: AMP-dependent synthetase/ligase, partial [Flavobacteriales bacterium]
MEVKRIFDLLDRYKAEFPHKSDALAGKAGKQWKTYSTEAYIEYANLVSYGLLALGLKKGDKIATICNNRPEWNFIDMGMAQLGIIHVPLFTTLDSNGYREILQHAEVNLIFISSSVLYKKIASFETELESLKSIYTLDEVEGARNWLEVVETGRKEGERYQAEVEKIKNTISDTDVATLIYTSGTTGKSKGVLLTHRNLISTAKVAAGVFQLQPGQRYLSILPICHVGERMANYQTQYSGCSLYYTESLTTLGRDLQFVKPHGFGAVPRILEKVYEKIISKGRKLQGVKRKLFFWALGLAERFELDGANGIWYSLQLAVANKLIFSKWRDAMGGNVVAIGIGGAALQPRLERIFWAAGIKLLNMYGLTETSPIITINRQSGPGLHLGTVGSLVKGVEVKIAPDGEILCRGPNVMAGYYKDEEATRQAIDADGWF